MITYRELAMYVLFILSGIFAANAGWWHGLGNSLNVALWLVFTAFTAAVAIILHEGGSKK